MMRLVNVLIVGTILFISLSLLSLVVRYVEIFILAPASAVIFFLIYKELKSYPKKDNKFEKYLPIISVLAIAMLYVGSGMHGTTNYLSFMVYDAYGFYGSVPPALAAETLDATLILNQISFFDEILSHIFIYGALFIILICGAVLQLNHPYHKTLTRGNKFLLIGSAIVFGVSLFLSLVESKTSIPAFLIIVPIIFLIFQHRKDNWKKDVLLRYPFNFCITVALLLALVLVVIYGIIFSGLPQLSEFPQVIALLDGLT